MYPDSHQGWLAFGIFHDLEHCGHELVLIRDGVVRRRGDDRRVRVPLEDAVGREGDTWGCVAGVGFQKQVAFREFRNLRADEVGESGQCDHEDVLRWDNF